MKGILAVSLALLLGMIPIEIEGTQQAIPDLDDIDLDVDPDWLLLLYMAGDNNLGRDGYEWGNAVKMDLEEIEDTMPSSGVDILALADMEGGNNTYLYDLEPAPSRGVNSPTIDLSEVNPQWNDEVDMSDWRTLRDFLVFSLTNRSAEKVMFVLWNHGAGWYSSQSSAVGSRSDEPSRGFALDSHSSGAMFLNEFRDAFVHAEDTLGSLHMDIIGFDTCSMGMMEVYYQIAPWFDMAIGSEDEQPWYGYNYTFTSVMGGSNPYSPVELGNHIIQEFKSQYLAAGEYAYATITLVDLVDLKSNLTPALNDLSLNLFERMYQNEVVLNHKFNAVRGRTEMLGFENVDMGHFLENLMESSLHSEIRDNASKALWIYNDTILGEWHQPDGRNIWATGISIYLPPSGSYRTDYDGYTGFLDLTRDSSWDEMIREYHNPKERVKVDLAVDALDSDDLLDDVTISVINAVTGHIISNARVHINKQYSGDTDLTGQMVLKDMYPGTYLFEVYNGTHVGEATVKILNRAPVVNITPEDPVVYEKHFIILDGSGSSDPDGDRLTFKWDLDDSDGLNGSDSTSPWVNLSFSERGNYTVRLTVNDTELSSYIDVVIEVVNSPPVAVLDVPYLVNEDEPFLISALGSWDTWPDAERLLYLYTLNGAPIQNWTNATSINHKISEKGWYEIGLVVSDPEGEMAFAASNVQVLNVAPVANITGPTYVEEDEIVEFSSEGSVDTPSDIPTLSYKWYLSGTEGILSEEEKVELSFSEQGSNVLELHVTDDDGFQDIAIYWFDVVNVQPDAIIIVSDHFVYEDEMITLECSLDCDTPSDVPLLNFSWDIDNDGIFDLFGPSLEISWPDAGNYSVRLKVEDDDGNFSMDQKDILVSNLPPAPMIIGPLQGDEDEELFFELAMGIDTISDIPSLDVKWFIDGERFTDHPPPNFLIFTEKGTHNLTVNVTDDDGESGEDFLVINIRNPKPTIFMENVPASIEEGKEFTAYGYKSYDNPSDMDSLVYQWYLDEEPIPGATEKNLTMQVDGVGAHSLKLVVTDDDGDQSNASITFNVVEGQEKTSSLEKILDRVLSSIVFVVLVGMLFLLLLVIFQMNRKMKELPSPMKKELLNEEQEADPENSENDQGESHPSGEVSEPSEEDVSEDQEVLEVEDRSGIDDETFEIGDEMDIPDPPGLYSPTEAPAPPQIDDLDLPEVDGSIFEP